MKLQEIIENATNVAAHLTDEQLAKIGSDAVKGYETDLASRSEWEKDIKKYLKLAMQITETKTFPWPGAANVKYPAISTAAMQFAARAYPTLVPSNGNVVSVSIVSSQQTPEQQMRAKNVSKYMSYQVLNDIPDWEEGMDNLLLITSIFGIGFKKVYYSPDHGTNCSEMINPFNLVVNYWTKGLDECQRISHILYKSQLEVEEKKRAGVYLDIDLGKPVVDENKQEEMNVSRNLQQPTETDSTTPYILIEQHCYLDLDEDDFPEPYVVLVELHSKKVLRIVPRFDIESVEFNQKNQVQKIKADNYFVKYPFFPSPDGSFYTRGFGHLLGPLNESINTVLNQLIDAGTMSNLQSGFIGKGLKIRQGDVRFKPGEWKPVNSLGTDIKQNIFALPTREPSNVLFQLLGMMVQAGKELASVADIFVGKMPGQNTPAYTTQQTVEQGMKLFTAIYKRIYRSLTKEFRLLYALNGKYLDEQEYKNVLDSEFASLNDFNGSDKDILPSADPSASSEMEKQQKFQAAAQLMQLGTIDRVEYTKDALDVLGIDKATVERWMKNSPAMQPPQPSPEQMKAQSDMQLTQAKTQATQMNAVIKQKEAEFKMAMEQQKQLYDRKMNQVQKAMELQFKQLKASMEAKIQADKHNAAMAQAAQQHQQKMEQTATAAKSSKQPQPKKG